MNAKTHKIGLSTALTMLILFTGNTAFAAPGVLSDAPLFITTAVEPNIFFTLDDSGSMDWEAVVPDTDLFDYWYNGATRYHNLYQAYYHPGWSDYRYDPGWFVNTYDLNIIPPAGYSNNSTNPLVKKWWVMQNHNFNTTYYNPLTDYKPWPGVDSIGNPLYPAANPYHVYRDPNRRGTGDDFVDLTQHYDYFDTLNGGSWQLLTGIAYLPSYYTWTDDNTDGVLQATEGHTLVEITPGTQTYSHQDQDGNIVKTRSATDELQNFANWFEYYRKREFATKAAIGAVITKASGSRMGYRLINNGHKINLKTMTNATSKLELLQSFYNIDSNGGTPLRGALKSTGEMFKATTYNNGKVILPASEGGECQQNFSLLMTDGFWNGYTPSYIGNTDRSTDSTGFDGDENESNDGGNYEDDVSDTLADVAMKYYETDLRTDLANKVPITEGVDEATHQHMVTYTISFGVKGTLDIDTYDPLASGFSWPSPFSDPTDPHRIDDLLHAAYNGRGLYLSAQNPVELVSSLSAALADIEDRSSSQSAVSVSSAEITTDTVVYATEFNTSGWQGNIFAYPIVKKIVNNKEVFSIDIPTEPMDALNAAEVLASQVKSDGFNSGRTILTKNGTSGVPFKWSSISNEMKADLRINSGGTIDSDTTAQARLDYLRGDTSNEGAGLQFRLRAEFAPDPATPKSTVTNILGDIVHSSAVYIAKPLLNWPDDAPFPTGDEAYSKFKENHESRDGMIYVGANDGMIHGFSASDLKEKLAYVPSNLVSTETNKGLHYLTNPSYQHRYYNDLTPSFSDIYINGSWHTIAIFGQGAGGRGYSALDITNPVFSEATATNTVMWEFSSNDDADLGYTFSKPIIGLANNGEWVAVFGNGYNSDGNGQAALFIVKIRAGLDGSWDVSDYWKISTGSGDSSNPNGLSTPALADINGDGTIDRVYAGDLRGQMWAFDLSDNSPSNWQLAHGSTPLFTTIGQRPITTQPSLSLHPSIDTDSSNTPNIMLAFGTGQYLVDADKNSSHDNYFYGVWDKGDDSANLTASNLQEQTFTSSSPRILTRNSVDYLTKFGWYISLDITHERSVTDSFIRAGYVFFNTAIPSSDTCQSDAYGYRFIVDLKTGGTPNEPVIDTDGNGVVDSNDELAAAYEMGGDGGIPTADKQTREHLIGADEDGKIKASQLKPYPHRKTGRVSWQELLK